MIVEPGKTSADAQVSFKQIQKEIAYCEMKIHDNCNIIGQLKKEDMSLRNTIKLLKQKRRELLFGTV